MSKNFHVKILKNFKKFTAPFDYFKNLPTLATSTIDKRYSILDFEFLARQSTRLHGISRS